jgi:Flp pilus assembly protein TadG
MKVLLKNNRGAAAVEFALVALPVIVFIFGIMQTGWIVWIDNLLHTSVDTATRCVAVNSQTLPCDGNSLQGMQQAANAVFAPLSGTTCGSTTNCLTLSWNTNCSAGEKGVVGTYTFSFLWVVSMTLTAQSCYPTVVIPS